MSDVISPYINTEYHTRIDLLPHQMNNDVYKHLKMNLKKDVEKKCNKYGYVVKVFKITEYSEGEIEAENFMASAVYKIKFSCRMCIPNVKTKMICVISKTNKALIVAENGPIYALITLKAVNMKNFELDNNEILNYKKGDKMEKIKPKDMIKITILALKFNKGDNNIKVIGFLEDMATKKEKELYYNDLHFKEHEEEEQVDYIEHSDYVQSEDEEFVDEIEENETDQEEGDEPGEFV